MTNYNLVGPATIPLQVPSEQSPVNFLEIRKPSLGKTPKRDSPSGALPESCGTRVKVVHTSKGSRLRDEGRQPPTEGGLIQQFNGATHRVSVLGCPPPPNLSNSSGRTCCFSCHRASKVEAHELTQRLLSTQEPNRNTDFDYTPAAQNSGREPTENVLNQKQKQKGNALTTQVDTSRAAGAVTWPR